MNKLFVILDSFLAFYPPNNSKIKILKKRKKILDIIILYICNIYHNHDMYGSWDMERDSNNFLSFWVIFCPFTPLIIQNIKILIK